MKRNQVIAAMNALSEDCDVEFGVITLERQTELMTFMALFLALASYSHEENHEPYEPGQWYTAIIDVFSRLDMEPESKALVLQSAIIFKDKMIELDGNNMQSLAKLAMQ